MREGTRCEHVHFANLPPHRTEAYNGAIDCILRLHREEGLRGFYKGLGPALLKAVPNTMITFFVYDMVLALLVRQRQLPAKLGI